MKKYVLSGVLILALLGTGCSAGTGGASQAGGSAAGPADSAAGSSDPRSAITGPAGGGPGITGGPLGQRPDRPQDLLGKIVRIAGNKVVVAVLEPPEGWGSNRGVMVREDPNGTSPPGNPNSNEGPSERSPNGPVIFERGGDPAQQGDMRARIEAMSEQERQAFMQEMQRNGPVGRVQTMSQIEFTETGKTYTLLFPVGLTIQRGGASIDVSALQEENVLSIWVDSLNEAGDSKVVFAQLIQ